MGTLELLRKLRIISVSQYGVDFLDISEKEKYKEHLRCAGLYVRNKKRENIHMIEAILETFKCILD